MQFYYWVGFASLNLTYMTVPSEIMVAIVRPRSLQVFTHPYTPPKRGSPIKVEDKLNLTYITYFLFF